MKWTFVIGAFSAALSVALGAMGAHLVAGAYEKELIQLASYYHMVHSLGLILSGLVFKAFHNSAICFVVGMFLFSGSLYLSAFTQGALPTILAPFGGLLLILGWIIFGVSALWGRKLA